MMMILAFPQAGAEKRSSYIEPMIEIRFKSDQKVRPLLRSAIALLSLRSDECLICIFRKRGCVQGERRARHDKLRERLYIMIMRQNGDSFQRMEINHHWLTFNSFELVSIHSFIHVSRKST